MFYEFNHVATPDYFKKENGKDFNFPLHLHQCFEFIVLLSGKMSVTVDAKTYELSKDEAVLIFPNQIHSLSSKKSSHMLCIFSPQQVQAFATRLTGKIPVSNKFLPDKYLIKALTGLSEDASTEEKKGLLYLLCAAFDKSTKYCRKQTDSENLLFRVFYFVETNYKNDCSLEALSSSLGYDYSYLSRYFKKTVGISFNSYVNHYRLSHACYLMKNSDISILECAMDSGYSSLRSFNRNFKQYFNMTPIEYRKLNMR